MSISQRFWKTKAIATKEYKELEIKTAKVNTMVKEQIKIRVIKMLLSLPLWCF
jgi:hypothetical protein